MGYGLGLFFSAYRPISGCYEHFNESSVSMSVGKFWSIWENLSFSKGAVAHSVS